MKPLHQKLSSKNELFSVPTSIKLGTVSDQVSNFGLLSENVEATEIGAASSRLLIPAQDPKTGRFSCAIDTQVPRGRL